MKRLLLLTCFCVLAMLSVALFSCDDNDILDNEAVTIWFESYTGEKISPQTIGKGMKAAEPSINKQRAGYNFLGWYKGDKKWDFEKDTVSENITLTAKWEPYISFVEVEGALWIGGCDLLDTAVVDIPREYNGRSVVGILPFAFADRKKIEAVYIPSTVTEIREGAFFGCTALKKIYCEAEIKPSGWSDSIENSGAEFIFGYKK